MKKYWEVALLISWIAFISTKQVILNNESSFSDVKHISKSDVVLFDDTFLLQHRFRTKNSSHLHLHQFSGIEPCRDGGECFSGAWLSHMDHLTEHPNLEPFVSSKRSFLLHRAVCEDATNWFLHKMHRRFGINYAWGDLPGQTIDALDFSVLHLSTVDRMIRKAGPSTSKLNSVEDVVSTLSAFYSKKNIVTVRDMAGAIPPPIRVKLNETVAVMTMILLHQGLGSSKIAHRKHFLELTFCMKFGNVWCSSAAYVKTQKDYDFLVKKSQLPFKHIILIPDIPDCSLPIASVIDVRQKQLQGNWSFNYVYFTEADQLFLGRNLEALFQWADANIHGLLLPHRLVMVPRDIAAYYNKTDHILEDVNINATTLSRYKCCMDTGGHGFTRVHWKQFKEESVRLPLVHGIPVIMGNANFFSQNFRPCNTTIIPAAASETDSSADADSDVICPLKEDYLVYGSFSHLRNHYNN